MLPPIWAANIHSGDPKSNRMSAPHPACKVPTVQRYPALALAFAACLVSASWPGRVQAYEDQYTLGIGLGYAHLFPQGTPHPGALAELNASLGLDATWTARARVAGAWHPDDELALYRGVLGAELVYMIDILELVPSFGLGLDAVLTHAGPIDDPGLRGGFAANAVLGLDYLLSRELSLTFEARPYLMVTELSDEPLYLQVSVGLLWVFDR